MTFLQKYEKERDEEFFLNTINGYSTALHEETEYSISIFKLKKALHQDRVNLLKEVEKEIEKEKVLEVIAGGDCPHKLSMKRWLNTKLDRIISSLKENK